MKRILLFAAIAALALPATALGKGPSAASIDGPGTGGGINISGDRESGGTPLGDLTQQGGFFAATFGQQPDPMLQSRPKGDLGPKYTIDYTVPGPNNDTFHLEQDLYPYAVDGPVTYMKPGQKIFDMETRGGWYQAPAGLKRILVAAGLPKAAPSRSSSDDSALFSAELLSALVGAALLLAVATVILVRRREHPAPAA
jgi:hypothetical protein